MKCEMSIAVIIINMKRSTFLGLNYRLNGLNQPQGHVPLRSQSNDHPRGC